VPATEAAGAHPARLSWRLVLLGALSGLAWSAGLRGMMAEVAGDESGYTWMTVTWVLLPGTVIGALLGWAEAVRRTGGRRGWRWSALAPLLFAGILFSSPTDILGVFEDGLGAGAVGVPLIVMAGGFAVSGRGPLWGRMLAGVLALGAVPAWAFAAPAIDPGLALDTPRGAFVAALYWSFLALFALAAAIPHRPVVSPNQLQSSRA
jgi:hypothetical protein